MYKWISKICISLSLIIINWSFVVWCPVIYIGRIEELDLPVPIIICDAVILGFSPVDISCHCGEPEYSHVILLICTIHSTYIRWFTVWSILFTFSYTTRWTLLQQSQGQTVARDPSGDQEMPVLGESSHCWPEDWKKCSCQKEKKWQLCQPPGCMPLCNVHLENTKVLLMIVSSLWV